ncbi:MAG: hypothetical protein FWE32_09480 [Oscillospiraceae bacterium]|nr:hypothetical protein [Oscillospiraceae bacterium]
MAQIIWLALGYNVPVNPSKNRVYVWRKLKEFGAGYFRPGVAILPKTSDSLNQFRVLSQKIRDMGGESVMAELRFLEETDEQKTVKMFNEQSRDEYMELMKDCAHLMDNLKGNIFPDQGADSVRKMMRRYGKVKSRDYFKSGHGGEAAGLLDELAGDIAHSASELSKQLKNLLID